MKVVKSGDLSAFGGLNFVFESLNNLGINRIVDSNLPSLKYNSKYSWTDVFYSFMSIYFCGGDCIEDLNINLRHHLHNNPMFKLPSPDTVLRRLSSLAVPTQKCFTQRGSVEHEYCTNEAVMDVNLRILKKLGVFKSSELTLDYDNTIIFSEKKDCKMTYKRDYGYQPGVCTVNEEHILYIENRNGNSDAKSFQDRSLERIFNALEARGIRKVRHFRADAASYQYEIIKLLADRADFFYVGCRNSYVEKYFTHVGKWSKTFDAFGELEVGSIMINPFSKNATKDGETPASYRLLVKRRKLKSGQMNIITQDAYEYRAVLSNNFEMEDLELAAFYAKRGNMEKQFDILKNDFGWQKMPFSNLNENLVFLYFSAICRNLYHHIICSFSKTVKYLKPEYRIKKFIFRFIILPSKWIIQGRQYKLRIYSSKDCFT